MTMSKAVYFNTYKLKKGSSAQDFLAAVNDLFTEIVKNKGCVSSALLVAGETWADYTVFETMDDLNAFVAAAKAASVSGDNEAAQKFYSFLNFNSCKSHHFNVEKSYNRDNIDFSASDIISYHSYNLKKDASAQDFLLAMEKLNEEFVIRQKGWVTSKSFFDGKTWADIVVFETQNDLDNFVILCNTNELTKKGSLCMDFSALVSHTFTVERRF